MTHPLPLLSTRQNDKIKDREVNGNTEELIITAKENNNNKKKTLSIIKINDFIHFELAQVVSNNLCY